MSGTSGSGGTHTGKLSGGPTPLYSSDQITDRIIRPEEPSAVELLGDVATGQRRPARYRLPHLPVKPGSVVLMPLDPDAPVPFMTDDSNGNLGGDIATIDYKTGIIETHDPLPRVPLKAGWIFCTET